MVLVERPASGRDADCPATTSYPGPPTEQETTVASPGPAASMAGSPIVLTAHEPAEPMESLPPPDLSTVPPSSPGVPACEASDVRSIAAADGRGGADAGGAGETVRTVAVSSGDAALAVPTVGEPPPCPGAGTVYRVAPPLAPADVITGVSRRRERLLMGGAVAAGVALALGVFGVLTAWNSSGRPSDSNAAESTAAPRPARISSEAPKSVTATSQPGVPPAAKRAPSEPIVTPSPTVAVTAKPSTPPAEAIAAGADSDSPKERPAAADPAAATTPPRKPTVQPAAPDTPAAATGFSSFAPFMDTTPIAPAQPAAEGGLEKPSGTESAASQPDQPVAPRPAPRHVDVAQRLQDEISAIEFVQTPLIDVLQFISSFSTIPITADPDALALVKVTPQTPVSVKLDKTHVEQVLTAALQPLRLGYIVSDGQVLVTRPPGPHGTLRQHKHSVQDLVGDDSRRLGQLTDLIVAMVEPEAWATHGGAGALTGEMPFLVIEQRDTVLFRTLLFCDQLRVARELPPQTGFNPELFQLTPRTARAAQALATRVTMNYLTPTLLVRILDQVRKDTGVQVLVDWQAVAELGWTPDAETTIAVNDQTLAEALEKLLRPLALTDRVIDGRTLEITTPASLATRWDVEFYPAGRLITEQQTPAQLCARIRHDLGLPASGGAFHFDPLSKCLIAALPQPQQRRLAELLTQWQTP